MNINDCRPEVQKFAVLMEQVLRQNDCKGGWKYMDDCEIVMRIREEMEELHTAVFSPLCGFDRKAAVTEAIDVANFCMFLADIYGELDQTEGK